MEGMMLRRGLIVLLISVATVFCCRPTLGGGPPLMRAEEYEERLRQVNILLTRRYDSAEKIRRWLDSYDSAYPHLTDKVLRILSNRRPRENPVYLDEILAEYRKLERKKVWEKIRPPLDVEKVKEAYIQAWKKANLQSADRGNQNFESIAPPAD